MPVDCHCRWALATLAARPLLRQLLHQLGQRSLLYRQQPQPGCSNAPRKLIPALWHDMLLVA